MASKESIAMEEIKKDASGDDSPIAELDKTTSTLSLSSTAKEDVKLYEKGVVMNKLVNSETFIIDAVDHHAGLVVCHHRSSQKIGYLDLNKLGMTKDSAEKAIIWTDIEHGQNILCALRAPLFAFDISGSHLGANASFKRFRVVNLFENRVISDHELPELCTAMEFDHTMHIWTADTAGYVYTHTLSPPTTLRQQLPSLDRTAQVLSFSALPPGTDTSCGAVMVAVTQSQVHIIYASCEPPLSFPLPECLKQRPPDIMVDIEGSSAGVIPIPSHDEIDHVWQVRCMQSSIVVIAQNSVLIRGPKAGTESTQEWLQIANLPCIMDAIELDASTGSLAFSHINGDVFVYHPSEPERQPTILTPESHPVVGRKADANSHMLCSIVKDGFCHVYAARPEGMVDACILKPDAF